MTGMGAKHKPHRADRAERFVPACSPASPVFSATKMKIKFDLTRIAPAELQPRSDWPAISWTVLWPETGLPTTSPACLLASEPQIRECDTPFRLEDQQSHFFPRGQIHIREIFAANELRGVSADSSFVDNLDFQLPMTNRED